MMTWTPELRDFIQQHLNDDTAELLLAARRYQGIDVPFAVEQIGARKRLKGKLPEWYANAELVMGGRVPAEQCSSEATARYKRSIIEGKSLCDMTGGMGVDFWYMSEGMERAIYTERNEELCEIAQHNFRVLKDGKHPEVEVRCGDGRELSIPSVDVIYLDPARRAGDGSRVYAMEDCEPNIVEWQDELLSHAGMVLVKLSPMVDLTDVLRKLKGVTDVYVVGVKNECKEVLVKAPRPPKGEGCRSGNEVRMHCVDFLADRTIEYSYDFSENIPPRILSLPQQGGLRWVYEPDVTLMKAQAYGPLCQRFPVCQLDFETHLMTSDDLIPDFPGRTFIVSEQIPFSSKTLKLLLRAIPQANIATRNFIMTADQLRQRTRIKDGGDIYLFGAKVRGMGDVLLKCTKVEG
ncbi:MAG: SAM-dependent methyltransferase [Bacteroidaceae bacterium]|nr:SAM-dependent methyltransferase [Bacteroidaceae bacterium]